MALPAYHGLGADAITIRPSLPRPPFDGALYAENRSRLRAALLSSGVSAGAAVLLRGGASETRHETDHELLFRQESFFHWAFGVREPDCLGVLSLSTGAATLLIPRLPESYAVVMGAIRTPDEWRDAYGVDAVAYEDDAAGVLRDAVGAVPAAEAGGGKAGAPVLVLKGYNTDGKKWAQPATFEGAAAFFLDESSLWPAITELRVIKTSREAALLRYVAALSSEAHIAVMQATRAGMTEFQLESVFKHWCYFVGGARHASYTCICASGHNGSILHYGHAGEPNARTIAPGDMCLFDMGSEYECYGADITTSFPVGGRFTPKQRVIYDAVWDATRAVEDVMRPGVHWLDMQTLSYRVILSHLRDAGVLVGDVEEMMKVNLGAVFMPHGLGHFLGIDTHDVGGYNGGAARPTDAGYRSLRTTRALQEGMYLTVEPGCYFIDVLLDAALADPARSRFLVADAVAGYRGFGGVRIEDDVLVTADGIENFTWAPRWPDQVEAACAGVITSIRDVRKYK